MPILRHCIRVIVTFYQRLLNFSLAFIFHPVPTYLAFLPLKLFAEAAHFTSRRAHSPARRCCARACASARSSGRSSSSQGLPAGRPFSRCARRPRARSWRFWWIPWERCHVAQRELHGKRRSRGSSSSSPPCANIWVSAEVMETIALDNSVSPLRVVAIAMGESDVCCRWKLFGFT